MIAKNNFNLNRKSNIFIYGALNNAKALCDILQSANFNIKGFIDRRAAELRNTKGKTVYDLNNIPIEDSPVVIVTVKNVFEHRKIATKLAQKGIYRVIFYPPDKKGCEFQTKIKHMKKLYNHLASLRYHGNFVEIKEFSNIPTSFSLILNEWTDYGVISEKDGFIYAYIPVTFIFSHKKNKKLEEKDCNIASLTYVNFFDYFNGKRNSKVDNYIKRNITSMEIMGNVPSQEWIAGNIATRQNIYYEMNRRFNIDPTFFMESIQEAFWDHKNKYFTVNGGRHRLSFLISKGYEYLPLKVLKKDYDIFLNEESLKTLTEYLDSNGIHETVTNVAHPYFYHFPASRAGYFSNVMKHISSTIANLVSPEFGINNSYKNSIAIMAEDDGSVARYLSRMGFNVFLSRRLSQYERLVNDLLFVNLDDMEQIKDQPLFDFAFVSGMSKSYSLRKMKKLLNRTQKGVFYEVKKERFQRNTIRKHLIENGYSINFLSEYRYGFDVIELLLLTPYMGAEESD